MTATTPLNEVERDALAAALGVYQALRSASQDHHLPAFQRCVERGGSRQRGRRA